MYDAGFAATLFGRPGRDDRAAAVAAFGAEVDQVVGGLDDVEVVLDHEHRIPDRDQPLQDVEQLVDVGEVQAGRRLVEHVERAPGRALRELGRQLDALRLAARELRRRLTHLDVAQPDLGRSS